MQYVLFKTKEQSNQGLTITEFSSSSVKVGTVEDNSEQLCFETKRVTRTDRHIDNQNL